MAVVVITACGVLGAVLWGGGGDPTSGRDLQIVARNTRFPEKVRARAGTFGIAVKNRDSYRHTFVIEGQGVKSDLAGRESRHIEVTLSPGTYRFFCDLPGHESMAGVLEVIEDG